MLLLTDYNVDNVAHNLSPVGGWDAEPNYPSTGAYGVSISWDSRTNIYSSDTLVAGTSAILTLSSGGVKALLTIHHKISSIAADSNGSLSVGGLAEYNGNVGGFSIVELSSDGATLNTNGVVYSGTGYEGASRQGESIAISANGKVIAVGGPQDSSTFDVRGTVTELVAVWTFSYDTTNSVWAQMTQKITPRDFREGTADVRMGLTVSLETYVDMMCLRRHNRDAKFPGAVLHTATSGNAYEIAKLATNQVTLYKETMYFRIKIKM